jgi:hypothetical protein
MHDKRSKYLRYAAIATLTLAALAAGMGRKEKSAKISTGIQGKVEIWEGNFMPMIDPKSTSNKITPGAGRRVRVYAPLTVAGGLMSAQRDSIESELVAETRCDKSGMFMLDVPAGTYSVFVEEGAGWYANGFDGDGVQGAVVVSAGKLTEVTLKITAKATY